MFIFWKIKIRGVHLIEGFPNATRQRPEHSSFTIAARRQTAPPHHTHNLCWHGPRQRSHGEMPFLHLPFYFFAATMKCLYKRHLPYYLSTDIDFVCVLCTSSSTAAVASRSLPLSLSLFKGTSHNNVAISLPTLLFFRSYNEVFVQTAFIPYFPSGTFYFSICDHGPDSLHAVLCDKLTFFPLTGGCSEGLGAFRFFFK